jgi:hypothetical protein
LLLEGALAFNGSGVFSRVHSWATDKTNTVAVTASRMDAEDDGFATGLSNCLVKDGQQTATARIPFALGVSAMVGTTAGVSYSATGDVNTGVYFPASDQVGLVAGGTEIVNVSSTGITVTGTLTPSGQIVGSAGTVGAPGYSFASDLDCGMYRIGANNIGLAVNGAKVVDIGTAGVSITGTLTSSGALTVSAGGAAVTGNSTVTGTLGVSSDFAVNTSKFTVAASSGNTAVAGTLAVTGASTLTGTLSANNSAGITARNSAKAFGSNTAGGLVNAFNIASITDDGAFHTVTFTSAMSGTDYSVMLTGRTSGGLVLFASNHATGSFRVNAVDTAGVVADPGTYTIVVFENA